MTPSPSRSPFASRITGTGSAFPRKAVTNDDLSKILDTSDQWIRERTGIRERRIAERHNPEEQGTTLAAKAAFAALEMAGKKVEDIDAIFYATCTPDQIIPASHCNLQRKLGATRAWGIDLNAACSGFVYAMATADQFIRSGSVKTALVVGADLISSITNWKDRSSAILFGDAAGAVILEQAPADSPSRVLSFHLGTDGRQHEILNMIAGGSNLEITPEAQEKGWDKMYMNGREVFKLATRTLAEFGEQALASNGYTVKDLDWFIPHQANLRIIEAVSKRLECPMDRVLVNIERFGNTSSATIPTALDEAIRDGRIKPGQLLLFNAFGGGVTYGSMLVRM